MPRHIATIDPTTPRLLLIHTQTGRLWTPERDDATATELADIALYSHGWRRIGDWAEVAGVHSAPVEPDPGQPLDQYSRDLEIGDARRSGSEDR